MNRKIKTRNIFGRNLFLISILTSLTLVVTVFGCKHKIDQIEPQANNGTNDTTGTNGGANTGGTNTGGGGSNTGGNSGGVTESTCDPDTVYFEKQVLPILISNCTKSGCHNETDKKDGVILTSYEQVMKTADVRPGRPGSSDLYEMITESDADDRMPKGGPALTSEQISLIRKWIEQGAEDLTCTESTSACNTENISFSGYIQPFLQTNCGGCHSGSDPSGGINLTTYNGVSQVAQNGKLSGVINHSPGFTSMPLNGDK